jgi:hypothetical protein
VLFKITGKQENTNQGNTTNQFHTTQQGFVPTMNGFSQQPLSYKFQPSTRFEDSKRASIDARKYNAFGNKKTRTGPKKIAASIKLAVWFCMLHGYFGVE